MRIDRIIFTVVFWIMILVPAPLVLTGLSGDTSLEARVLVPYPAPTWATSYKKQTYEAVSAALEDRMPLRTGLVGFRSSLARQGLIPNPFDKVVLGQDGWLYVATSFDPHCPEDDRATIAARLSEVADLLEQHDIPFLVALIPNKASIHESGIPGWIESEHDTAQERTNAMRLQLIDEGSWFIDLVPPLRTRHRASPDDPLYYPTDTHWNWRGAEVFIEAIVERLHPGLYDPDEIVLIQTVPAHLDLDRLSGSSVQRELNYYAARRPGTTELVLQSQAQPIPAIVTTKGGDKDRLIAGDTLLVRDSFWDHVAAVGAEYFESLASVHATDAQNLQALAKAMAQSDTVIFETGERKFCEVMLSTIAADTFSELLTKALEDRDH
ncbi:MAG: hypothetical protein VX527_03475 [Planctomycetota bacterium]|nr:hypothetical protein [Planctomycetota bacterium]